MTRIFSLIALLTLTPTLAAADLQDGLDAYQAGRFDAALSSLNAFVESGDAASDKSAEALYLIATIHQARGESEPARAALERLLEAPKPGPFELNALDRLSELALSSGDYETAKVATDRFIERFLGTSTLTVQSSVVGQMVERLVDVHQQAEPMGTRESAYAALAERFPVESWTGKAVRVHAPRTVTLDGNLLRNPGFEWDGVAVGFPIGWEVLSSEPEPTGDLDGAMGTGAGNGLVEARQGEYCGGKYTSFGNHRGWFYQQVAVKPGVPVEASAWGSTPMEEHTPGQVRLGLDPRGGTDPQVPDIRWSEYVSAADEYTRLVLPEPAITPTGATVTVFLEIRQDTPAPANAMVFDDVQLKQVAP